MLRNLTGKFYFRASWKHFTLLATRLHNIGGWEVGGIRELSLNVFEIEYYRKGLFSKCFNYFCRPL